MSKTCLEDIRTTGKSLYISRKRFGTAGVHHSSHFHYNATTASIDSTHCMQMAHFQYVNTSSTFIYPLSQPKITG